MKEDRSIVGSLINFRGLVYSPVNEQGVVFLFGRVLDDLNMYIEEAFITGIYAANQIIQSR
jgi:hypothetical protein